MLKEKSAWDRTVRLSDEAKEEIAFWVENIGVLGKATIHPSKPIFTHRGASDASDFATGGWILGVKSEEQKLARELLNDDEKLASSTLRELLGAERSIESLTRRRALRGATLQWRLDSQAAVFVLWRGSRLRRLDVVAKRIWAVCVQRGIAFHPVWVPREQNQWADTLSKIEDESDWAISEAVFAEIDEAWGPFTIDRFASFLNARCRRFNSRWYCRGAEAVDAFTQPWAGEVNWCNPPFVLIDRVFDHFRMCGACGTVLVPDGEQWRHLPWFTRVFGPSPAAWVLETWRLPRTPTTFLRGGVEVRDAPAWDVWAVRVDFTAHSRACRSQPMQSRQSRKRSTASSR